MAYTFPMTPVKSKAVQLGGTLLTEGIATRLANRPTDIQLSNIAEMEKLQRRKELGQLGLTEQERSLLESQYAGQLGSIAQEGAARRAQLGASFDTMGGSAIEQMGLTDRALAEGRAKATAAITEADIKRRADEEKLLMEREAIESERQAAIAKSRGDLLRAAGKGALGIFSEKIEEEGTIDPTLVSLFMKQYGIQDKTIAKSAIKRIKGNPDLASVLFGAL
jgi:hypothetical protein